VCEEFAVAAHAGVAAVEDGGFVDVVGVGEPVPVLAVSDMC
jgi:hypothetical protein